MSRLFLAIPVRLADYEKIRTDFSPLVEGRWVKPEQLHVTLVFLGKLFEADVVIDRLSKIDLTFEPSPLSGLDYLSRSRVFVATTQNPSLRDLYSRIASLLGLPENEPLFHATLMRVKKINVPEIFYERLCTSNATKIGELEPRLILYSSRLLPQGAQYNILYEWVLPIRNNDI